MHLWWLGRAREVSQDARCQDLPQPTPQLVEGIDLPDGALREDTVFVQRDERAQRVRVLAGRRELYWWERIRLNVR